MSHNWTSHVLLLALLNWTSEIVKVDNTTLTSDWGVVDFLPQPNYDLVLHVASSKQT